MKNRIRHAIRAYHRDQAPRPGLKALAALPLALLTLTPDAIAQATTSGVAQIEEVIVSARRKDELLQDVPLSVNVVGGDDISQLNLRRLEDLDTVVAGLTLADDPIAPNASLRGVRFDAFSSGFNPTVEFYLNDAPIVSSGAMQGLFDIAQIEVLRGPQGTLRGRTSPSGAINLTTQQPNLQEIEGYIDVTATNIDGSNVRGAVNVPIVQDKLALRIAGFREENDGRRVRSINTGKMTETQSEGWRASVRFEPTDTLFINLLHQRITPEHKNYVQMESANLKNPNLAPSATLIEAEDRLALTDIYSYSDSTLDRTNLEIGWDVGDYTTINYIGALTEQELDRKESDDTGDVFGPAYPRALQELGQALRNDVETESHELRLTSEFDRFDVVVGALHQTLESVNNVEQQTPVFAVAPTPGTFLTVAKTPIVSAGESTEKSVFGNVTYHLTDDTELSAGLRYINFKNDSETLVSGRSIASSDREWNETVYLVSLKHTFSPDLMAYATLGSSWRPGINTVGNFNTARTALEQSFIELDPEESESLELGIKSVHMDNRLRLNGAVFYQQFDNFPYRTGGEGVDYVSTNAQGVESVETFNFVAAVPVDVYGVELEAVFQATENWNVGALYSWSKGLIDDATVPCNDYLPADGQPDTGGASPTVGDIRGATGGDNLGTCQADFRANFAPLWTATLQSEYVFPTTMGAEAYVRGLLSIYGPSQNDPTNSVDDVSSYNILNLYAGLRSDDGKWEVMLYGKNVLETERVLTREAAAAGVNYTLINPSTGARQGATFDSNYREITMTEPREVGVNVRYNF